jgi:hypothetical protein
LKSMKLAGSAQRGFAPGRQLGAHRFGGWRLS